jgi:hypothetical protein
MTGHIPSNATKSSDYLTDGYPTQPYDLLFTVLHSQRIHTLKLLYNGKVKKPQAFKIAAPTGLLFSYKSQKKPGKIQKLSEARFF